MTRPPRGWVAVAAVTGLTVGAVSALCRAPGVLYADAGELLTAIATKGVAHPPGFPLYLLLSGLWYDALARLVPAPASRLNLFSSVCAGLAAGAAAGAGMLLLSRVGAVVRSGSHLLLGAAAGLLVGFGPTLFDFSLGIEVYAIHGLFLALALAFAVAGGAEEDARLRRRLTILAGLAAGAGLAVHHATMVVSLPGLAVLLWGSEGGRERLTRVGLFVLALLPGLASYAILPLRAARQPVFNWGDPSSPLRFWQHVSAHIYQVNIESSVPVILEHAGRFLEAYREELSAFGLVLAVVGLLLFWKRGRGAAPGLLIVVLGDVAFAVRYEIAEDQAAYYIPTFIATALLLVLGVAGAAAWAGRRGPRAEAAVLAASAAGIALLLGRNVSAHGTRFRDGRAPETARNVLLSLPRGALAFTPEWNVYAPVRAAIEVEGERPDLLVLDVLLLRRGWYLDSFSRRHPGRYQEVRSDLDAYRRKLADWEEGRPYDSEELTRLYDTLTRRLAEEAWKRGASVAWVGSVMREHLPPGAVLVPCGVTYRILPSREAARGYLSAPVLSFEAALRAGLPPDDVFEAKVRPLYVALLTQRGLYERAFGKREAAQAAVALARRLGPLSAEAAEADGDLREDAGRVSEAVEAWTEAVRLGGDPARLGEKSRRALATPSPRTP